MTYEDVYDAVVMFAGVLEDNLHDSLTGKPDYRQVKALAACYELQHYLANFFAEEKELEKYDALFREALKELPRSDYTDAETSE